MNNNLNSFKMQWLGVGLSLFFAGQSVNGMAQPSSAVRHKNLNNTPLIAEINSTIPQLLDSASIPGMAISVIRDGKMAYTQVYGVKSTKSRKK